MSAAKPNHLMVIIVIIASMVLIGITTGINTVIFPTTMEKDGISNTVIGLIMSVEIASVILVSIFLAPLMRLMSMRVAFILTTFLRVIPLLMLPHFRDMYSWFGLVFLHGIGTFTFQIMLQTWMNSIPFEKSRGLIISALGTSISIGIAAGPVVLTVIDIPFAKEFLAIHPYLATNTEHIPFIISAVISGLALLPVLLDILEVPAFKDERKVSLTSIIRRCPAVIVAGAFAGASIGGVQAFITLYGMQNGMELSAAALLLSAFMVGSLTLESPIAALSDYFDRRYVIMIGVSISLICAVYLPIAIYTKYQAWALLFLWGGVTGGVYSICLAIISERFRESELVVANASFSIMDSIGGAAGVMVIGVSMDLFDSDGLPYTIMLAGILYLSFALTRYIEGMGRISN